MKKGEEVKLVYTYGCQGCGERDFELDEEFLIKGDSINYLCPYCGSICEDISGLSDLEVSERILNLLWWKGGKNEVKIYMMNGKYIGTVEM